MRTVEEIKKEFDFACNDNKLVTGECGTYMNNERWIRSLLREYDESLSEEEQLALYIVKCSSESSVHLFEEERIDGFYHDWSAMFHAFYLRKAKSLLKVFKGIDGAFDMAKEAVDALL